ncbi:hypothetical protein GCM10022240_04610 [Microbacterium kribbense]|uniref:Uncharacterized protein n=1 Tax=Microbacterium kribbense TaxID=433645 RepID=A0ABP7G4Y1_9MICO
MHGQRRPGCERITVGHEAGRNGHTPRPDSDECDPGSHIHSQPDSRPAHARQGCNVTLCVGFVRRVSGRVRAGPVGD